MTTRIVPSQPAHLEEFRRHWDAARAFQAARNLPQSPVFPEEQLRRDMADGGHFRGVREDDTCVGFFSVTLSDTPIWGEREQGDAIYIHRMCVNPAARGAGFSADVLIWARGHAASLGRERVRMDTWASNRALVDYYRRCGFEFIGLQDIGHDPALSSHYHGITLALFENPAGTVTVR